MSTMLRGMSSRFPAVLKATLGGMLLTAGPLVFGGMQEDFAQADVNGDGVVSRAEYRERMVDVFYALDAGREGYLTVDEMSATDRVLVERANANGDGKLSLQEFLEFRIRDFDRADNNGDGVLSPDEVRSFSG